MTRLPMALRGDSIDDYMYRTREEHRQEQLRFEELSRMSKERRDRMVEKRRIARREAMRLRKAAAAAEHPLARFSASMSGMVAGWLGD